MEYNRLKFSEITGTIEKLGYVVADVAEYIEDGGITGGNVFAEAAVFLWGLFKEEYSELWKETFAHGFWGTVEFFLEGEGYDRQDFLTIQDFCGVIKYKTTFDFDNKKDCNRYTAALDLIDLLSALKTNFERRLWGGLVLVLLLRIEWNNQKRLS